MWLYNQPCRSLSEIKMEFIIIFPYKNTQQNIPSAWNHSFQHYYNYIYPIYWNKEGGDMKIRIHVRRAAAYLSICLIVSLSVYPLTKINTIKTWNLHTPHEFALFCFYTSMFFASFNDFCLISLFGVLFCHDIW